MRPATVLVAAAVALTGCGGDDDDNGRAASARPAAQSTDTATTPPRTERPPAKRARPAAPARKRGKALPAPTAKPGSSGPLTDGPGPGSKPARQRSDLDNPDTGRGRPVGRSRASTRAAERRAVLRVMGTFLRSLGSGDTVQACAQLTPAGKRRLERRIWKVAPEVDTLPCEAALPVYRSAYGKALAKPRFKKLRLTSTRASALGPGSEPFRLTKRHRTWKIDRFGSR